MVWIGLHEPDITVLHRVQRQFELHDLAIEDADHAHQRPKIEEYGNSMFVVLQAIEMKGEELQVGEIEIFVGPNYILSVRMHSERGFQSVRTRCESEPMPTCSEQRQRCVSFTGNEAACAGSHAACSLPASQ